MILDFDQVIELDLKYATVYNKNIKKVVIAYFQSAYNQHCIQDENTDNKISVNSNFKSQIQAALEMAKTTPSDSECHKAYSKYKDILDMIMKESLQ